MIKKKPKSWQQLEDWSRKYASSYVFYMMKKTPWMWMNIISRQTFTFPITDQKHTSITQKHFFLEKRKESNIPQTKMLENLFLLIIFFKGIDQTPLQIMHSQNKKKRRKRSKAEESNLQEYWSRLVMREKRVKEKKGERNSEER